MVVALQKNKEAIICKDKATVDAGTRGHLETNPKRA